MAEAKKPVEDDDDADAGPSLPKAKKERSPSYPAISLQAAMERARQFFAFARRNPARTTDAMVHWGFSEKSSGGRVTLAALLKFGLLEEEGRKEDRHVHLSKLALDILLDERPESPERDKLLKQAALKPAIHSTLWEKYGHDLPAEAIVRTYLIRDMKFTDTAVNELITEYKATVQFAKLTKGDKITSEGAMPPAGPPVKVGDFVQWTSGGVEQFPDPLPVRGFSDDGGWAFVEGTLTGLPVGELTVVKRAMEDSKPTPPKLVPPPNPFAVSPPKLDPSPPSGFKEDAYDLAEGRAVFRWPEKLTPESVAELEDWFNLLIRKMARMTGAKVKTGTVRDVAKTTGAAIPTGGGGAIIVPDGDK